MSPRSFFTLCCVAFVPSCVVEDGREQALGTEQQTLTQTLRQPFAQTSYICQSYRGFSHSANYALDIGVTKASCNAGNDDSGGKTVVAPASGTVTWVPTSGLNAFLCIKFDGGGAVALGHVKAVSGIAIGTKVTKGQTVATIAHASDTASGNNGIAHLHFEAFDGTACYNGNPKPFTGAFKMDCAPDLPFNATPGYYIGTPLTPCSSSGGTGGAGGTGGGASGGTGGTGGTACVPKAVSGAENEFFEDLPPGAVAKAEAEALFNANITNGCSTTPRLFCPDCVLTRAQAVQLLVNAANLSTANPPATPTFSDVPVSSPSYAAIEAAAKAGITTGCGGGKFCPDDGATRASLATFVVRTLNWPLVQPATPTYPLDVPLTHPFFREIETISEHCVTTGCGTDKYCPDSIATRATAAIFIARAFDLEGLNPCSTTTDGGGSAGAGGAGAAAGSDSGTTGGSGGGGFGKGGTINASDAGPRSDAGTRAESDEESGCGCRLERRSTSESFWLLTAMLALVSRRRRKR